MSGYVGYQEYRDSGVEWLWQIPNSWHVEKIKHYSFVYPSNVDKKTVSGETPVKLCNYTDVYYNDIICHEIKFMAATASDEQIERFSIVAGDTLITKDSEDPADIAIPAYVEESLPGVVCGYHLAVLRPRSLEYGKFIFYLFNSRFARSYFHTRANGLTRHGVGSYALLNFPCALPRPEEAVAIASFLDHETAKIDTLIEKQQQLIKLLKEKRQAVISHAVTKGLNPDAPMTNSGVEWLGKVPAGWDLSRVGWLCEYISYGFTNPMPSFDVGPYMLTATDIDDGRVKYESARMTSKFAFDSLLSNKSKPRIGDLLLTKDGTLGRVAVFLGEHDVCISQSVALLRFNRKVALPEFVALALSSSEYQSRMQYDAGGTTIKHIYITTLAKMFFAVPSRQEQEDIVEALKGSLKKFDVLIENAVTLCDLELERRAALVSAAVTGKIDVRNWQPPKPAPTLSADA